MLTTEGDALLADVIANPGDDTPRLVYADWLDDRGDGARAEFIRASVAAERAFPGGGHGADDKDRCRCEYCALRRRERELLESHAHVWLGPFAAALGTEIDQEWRWGWATGATFADEGGDVRPEFRRGFVGFAEMPLAVWLARGPRLARAAPLEGVRLSDRAPQDYDIDPGPRVYGWISENVRPGDAFSIPGPLWELVGRQPGCEVRGVWADFPTKAAAEAALSQAALAWARR